MSPNMQVSNPLSPNKQVSSALSQKKKKLVCSKSSEFTLRYLNFLFNYLCDCESHVGWCITVMKMRHKTAHSFP